MGGIWSAFRAERRRRWASWLALALLVALVGGAALSGVVAAKRTASAFPDYFRRYGGDVGVFSSGPVPSASQIHGVKARLLTDYPALFTSNVTIGSTFIPSADMNVFALPSRDLAATMKLLSGRLPTAPDEALAGFSLEEQAGLHIGSVVKLPIYLQSQRTAVFSSTGTVVPKGPTKVFRIVGFEASMLDFPTSAPSYSLFVSRSFLQAEAHKTLWASIGFYRLANGATGLPRFVYDVNHLTAQGTTFYYPFSLDSGVAAIESSIHPQVVGWWIFALIACLAGLALVGQALARQSLIERESFPTLSALGFRPGQLFGLGMARALVVGVGGAAGALLVTYLVSPFTPVGEARAAEPVQGFVADALVLSLGALAIVVVVVLLAAYPAWRGAQSRTFGPSQRDPIPHESFVAATAARTGAPPPVLIGIRHALERGRGRSSVPVATALFGTIAAVTALSAASVFGVSLTHLLDTPTLYGQNWSVDVGSLNAAQAKAIATRVANRPGVEAVTYGVSNKAITINGSTSANVMILTSAKGPDLLGVVNGHLPDSIGQIALGSETMAEAHTRIGAIATVGFIAASGRTAIGRLRVVGTAVFPPVVSNGGGLGDGATIGFPTVFSLLCTTTAPTSPCVRALEHRLDAASFTNWGMAIATAHSAAGQREAAAIEKSLPHNVDVITVPVNLLNFGQAVNFPELLGAMVALYGAATLLHLLLVSVARRRRELALLKVLGFVRTQAAGAVCWQAATVAAVGLVIGVPLGIALGHLAWTAFANSVGAVPASVVPVALLLEIAAVVLVGSIAIAAVPAIFASRLRPAAALREA